MECITEDVLVLLFEEVGGGEVREWPDAVYDHEKARAPFLISSVCRHWRNIARNIPTLWTYFGFPDDPFDYQKHGTRLQVLLKASGSAPVDVIVAIGTAYNYYYPSVRSDLCYDILAAVGGIGARWRNVRFRVPDHAAERLRPALQNTLPQLVSISMVTDADWYFLSSAPRLLCLYLESPGLTEPTAPASHLDWTFPSLSSLIIFTADPDSTLASMLYQKNATWLRYLTLLDPCREGLDIIINFPQLMFLEVDDHQWLAHLSAPNLQSLALNGNGSSQVVSSDVLAAFAGVVELILQNDIDIAMVKHLSPLTGVRVLSFRQTAAIQTGFPNCIAYRVPDGFFKSLAGTGEGQQVWPLLERVLLDQPNGDNTAFEAEDLIRFVTERNEAYDTGFRATRRIIQVTVGGIDFR